MSRTRYTFIFSSSFVFVFIFPLSLYHPFPLPLLPFTFYSSIAFVFNSSLYFFLFILVIRLIFVLIILFSSNHSFKRVKGWWRLWYHALSTFDYIWSRYGTFSNYYSLNLDLLLMLPRKSKNDITGKRSVPKREMAKT
jgi:hypothetical protein